jgi:hypothetical protein
MKENSVEMSDYISVMTLITEDSWVGGAVAPDPTPLGRNEAAGPPGHD